MVCLEASRRYIILCDEFSLRLAFLLAGPPRRWILQSSSHGPTLGTRPRVRAARCRSEACRCDATCLCPPRGWGPRNRGSGAAAQHPRAYQSKTASPDLADQAGRLSCRLRGVLVHYSPQLAEHGLLPRLLLAQKKLHMCAQIYLLLSGQVLTGQDEHGEIGGCRAGPAVRQQLAPPPPRPQPVPEHHFGAGSRPPHPGPGTLGSGGPPAAVLAGAIRDDSAGGR